MEALPLHRSDLDHQADAIERALAKLSLPAHVQGGRIGERWVRYHVLPASATRAEQVLRAAEDVAQEIGVGEVRVAEEGQGFALDVPRRQQRALRLLPLLHAMKDLPSLTSVVGMLESGTPLTLNLNREATWNLWVTGPADCGKSELLRTLLLSLVLTSRPSHVNLMGVDIGGRELAVLESLPHMLTDLATDISFAEDLLIWITAEMQRRMDLGVDRPHLVLAIDDMEPLDGPQMRGTVERIIQDGAKVGVHIFAALRDLRASYARILSDSQHHVVAEAGPQTSEWNGNRAGAFRFHSAQGVQPVDIAWLSARDLGTAVRLVQAGWRASGYAPAGDAGR